MIEGHTTIGRQNRIFQFASLGAAPQDKIRQRTHPAEIGDNNTIREFCTFNVGTVQDGGPDPAGQRQLGDGLCAISPTIAGWATTASWPITPPWLAISIGDHVFLGGLTAVHQFCTIPRPRHDRRRLDCRGTSRPMSPPPATTPSPAGINSEGLRRRGFDAEQISRIKRAYHCRFTARPEPGDAKAAITEAAADDPGTGSCLWTFCPRQVSSIIR